MGSADKEFNLPAPAGHRPYRSNYRVDFKKPVLLPEAGVVYALGRNYPLHFAFFIPTTWPLQIV